MKQAQKRYRLLIADRSILFCRGLRTLLEAEEGFSVADVASVADETLAKVHALAPDVLVIDVELLQTNGPDFKLALRQAMSSGSILALTQEDGAEHLPHAIAAGAKAYMLKNSTPAQLASGIRQIALCGDGPLPISKIVPDLQALAARNEAKAQMPVLTTREREILQLLAEGKTAREVAEDLSLSIKTVEVHKLNLMRKLDIHHRTALIAYAARHGLIPAIAAY